MRLKTEVSSFITKKMAGATEISNELQKCHLFDFEDEKKRIDVCGEQIYA